MADDPFLAKIAFLNLSIFNLVMTTLDGSMPTCTDAPVKINAAVQIRGEREEEDTTSANDDDGQKSEDEGEDDDAKHNHFWGTVQN